jgi:hypothetical protein
VKISDLVKFRSELLEKKQLLSIHTEVGRIRSVLTSLKSTEVDDKLNNNIDTISNNYENVLELSDTINSAIDPLIAKTEKLIDQLAKQQFDENHVKIMEHYFLDGDHMQYYIKPEIDELVKVRLKQYTDWRFPTLQFGCRYSGELPRLPKEKHKTLGSMMNEPTVLHQFTDYLVVGDPLYVCDFKESFINDSIANFTPEYQRRLAKYVVKDQTEFSVLPKEQFSFIAVWNMFNFIPMEQILQYVKELYKLLTPGGTIMFSYNNGDDYKSAVLSESNMMSFVPNRLLLPQLEKIGFTINRTYSLANQLEQGSWLTTVSWVEATRPGKLETPKAHQAMGQILTIPQPKVVKQQRKWNTDQLDTLYKRAAELKIDHITRLRAGNYSPEVLEKMIKEKENN